MAEALLDVVNASVEEMEAELLPVTRHRGIHSLPAEALVKIMNLTGNCDATSPSTFRSTMRTFNTIPPFNKFIKDAHKLTRRYWSSVDRVWEGPFPEGRHALITELHLSTPKELTIDQVRRGLVRLPNLERLSIDCDFDFDKITSTLR